MSIGFLLYNPPLLVIIIFMGVWIIEALTIRDKLDGKPQKALFAALVVNLATTLLGGLIVLTAGKKFIIGDILQYEPIILIPLFFFVSILIEAVILYFYYRQDGWTKITSTGFLMNVKSYLFLIAFLVFDAMFVGAFIVVPYFFFKSFELLSAGKDLSKPTKTKAAVLLSALSIIVCVIVFFGAMKGTEEASRAKSAIAKAAGTKSVLGSLKAGIAVCCSVPTNQLQATAGSDMCNPPAMGAALPEYGDLWLHDSTDLSYAITAQCDTDTPTITAIIQNHAKKACDGVWTITEAQIIWPPDC